MKEWYIIAGPNGAGKTTASAVLLPEVWNCNEFVNADEIARGLSPFNPDGAAVAAARIMINRINNLIDRGENFVTETTLSGRGYKSLILKAQRAGYKVYLLFLWLSNEEKAIQRVQRRVRLGGHNIEERVIRRRYQSGVKNFFRLYKDMVDAWLLYDNNDDTPEIIAVGSQGAEGIYDNKLYQKVTESYV